MNPRGAGECLAYLRLAFIDVDYPSRHKLIQYYTAPLHYSRLQPKPRLTEFSYMRTLALPPCRKIAVRRKHLADETER